MTYSRFSFLQLLAFMHSQATFFHQGYDLLQEFDPFMKTVAGQVDIMRKDAAAIAKDMDSRHSLVSPKNLEVRHSIVQSDAHAQSGHYLETCMVCIK